MSLQYFATFWPLWLFIAATILTIIIMVWREHRQLWRDLTVHDYGEYKAAIDSNNNLQFVRAGSVPIPADLRKPNPWLFVPSAVVAVICASITVWGVLEQGNPLSTATDKAIPPAVAAILLGPLLVGWRIAQEFIRRKTARAEVPFKMTFPLAIYDSRVSYAANSISWFAAMVMVVLADGLTVTSLTISVLFVPFLLLVNPFRGWIRANLLVQGYCSLLAPPGSLAVAWIYLLFSYVWAAKHVPLYLEITAAALCGALVFWALYHIFITESKGSPPKEPQADHATWEHTIRSSYQASG